MSQFDRHEETDQRAKTLGEEIFEKSTKAGDGKSVFSKDFWYGRIMEWSMKNEEFKTQMFRFVDVLPYLNSGSDVAKHLKEYFAEGGEKLPSIFNFGVGIGSLAPGLMAGAVRKNVTEMAKMFITGETPKEAISVIKKARKNNIAFTVDLLGEATLSEKEALDYQRKYLGLVEWLAKDSSSWKDIELIDTNHKGEIPKVNVSVKLTSLYSQIKTAAWQESIDVLKERVRPIFRMAMENNVFINIDMEHYDVKDMTIEVFKQMLQEDEFKDYPHWGIVVQAYLRDSLDDCRDLINFAKERGTPITVRLVKGAYWDMEVIHSQQQGWTYPVYTNKQESDANYENCAREILENYEHVNLSIGSHNVRSISASLAMAERMGVPKNAVEVQMLYGMADMFKRSLVDMNYRVREYAPVGELIPGMAYLVRRLLENTSNESFLRSKFAENVSTDKLLKDPNQNLDPSADFFEKKRDFYNEPMLDFAHASVRTEMKAALEKIKTEFTKVYPVHINGQDIQTEKTLPSLNPSLKSEVVGQVHLATSKEADLAVATAKEKFKTWSRTLVEERVQFFEKLADIFVARRYEIMAMEVYEAGKGWSEADGDVTEAIDFCRYYAKEMRKLAVPQKIGWVPGEVNDYVYGAKGVVAVIAPWNFPLAILIGMTAAAAVTGNTVVMKPAEQTSIIAGKLMEMLREAGLPDGVVNFLPGLGEEVGEHLVNHKDVDFVAFTGSKAVGLHIIEKAGKTQPGQRGVKQCVIEMGGKNAIIVDSDADLDEAIGGVIYSAFGFQGQKCSACSRAIVLESNYDRFVERLVESTSSIKVRPSDNPEGFLGPVIDEEAYNKINEIIAAAKSESKLAFEGEKPEQDGFFVPPTIFTDVEPNARVAQEEIFGPVLAVIKAKDIEDAVRIANDTEYGLTGGVYSRSPANIDYVKANLDVGNLYVNRSITGAMVDRHPFGGFKMSGIGSKTGGPDYLKQFMEPKLISENTVRRGFAPENDAPAADTEV